jgi:hypothetical protein
MPNVIASIRSPLSTNFSEASFSSSEIAHTEGLYAHDGLANLAGGLQCARCGQCWPDGYTLQMALSGGAAIAIAK